MEAAFVCWYDNGRRRSYGQVAQLFGVSYETVRRAAWDYDWVGRAEHVDREAREIADKQLAGVRARLMSQVLEVALAELASFARRLPEAVIDECGGGVIPNPYRLRPDELSVADLLRATKLLEMAGVIGAGATRADEEREELEEMRRWVTEMYVREELEKMDHASLVCETNPI